MNGLDGRFAEELLSTAVIGGGISLAASKMRLIQKQNGNASMSGEMLAAGTTAAAIVIGELGHAVIEGTMSNMLGAGLGAVVGPSTVGAVQVVGDKLLGISDGLTDHLKSFGKGAIIDMSSRYIAQVGVGPYVRLPA